VFFFFFLQGWEAHEYEDKGGIPLQKGVQYSI